MKAAIKWAVAGLAFGTAFAQGALAARTERGLSYTESSYWATPRTAYGNDASSVGTSAAVNGPIVTTPQVAVSPGPTMAPWANGDDIRNANSALWGVGG